MAVGNTDSVAYSTDGGVSWTATSTGVGQNLNSVATDGRRWIAVGVNEALVISMDGGVTWSSLSGGTGTGQQMTSLVFSRLPLF